MSVFLVTLNILQLKSVSVCRKGKSVLKIEFNDIDGDVLIAGVESRGVKDITEDTTLDEKLQSESK